MVARGTHQPGICPQVLGESICSKKGWFNVKKILAALIIGIFTLVGIGCSGDKDKDKAKETKPAETKPAETKPAATKPAETKPAP